MKRLGYAHDVGSGESARTRNENGILQFSSRIDEFRRRPLVLSTAVVDAKPIMMLAGYCDHNIVRLRGRYYAIGMKDGPVNLDALSKRDLARLPSDTDMASLKQRILLRPRESFLRRFLRSARYRLGGSRSG
jgi:hypothetical protein